MPGVFSGVAWSTPQVLAHTRERLAAGGARWCELAPLWDVDTLQDWQRLQALTQADGPVPFRLAEPHGPLLLAPDIAERIVVVWTSGYPSTAPHVNDSFNLEQDLPASQLLMDCGVPLVYLPGFHVAAQPRLSSAEVAQHLFAKLTCHASPDSSVPANGR